MFEQQRTGVCQAAALAGVRRADLACYPKPFVLLVTVVTPPGAHISRMSITALLRGIPIFAELDEGSLNRLAERCVPRSHPAGHVLFTTGEPCRGLYIIETGRVRIYRTNPDGKEQVLHI